jgi:hypothetical protein
VKHHSVPLPQNPSGSGYQTPVIGVPAIWQTPFFEAAPTGDASFNRAITEISKSNQSFSGRGSQDTTRSNDHAPSSADASERVKFAADNAFGHRRFARSWGDGGRDAAGIADYQPTDHADPDPGQRRTTPPTVAALVGIALEACEFHDRLTHDCDPTLVACDVAWAALDTWEHDNGRALPCIMWSDLLVALSRDLIAEAAAEYHRRAAQEIAEAAEIALTEEAIEAAWGDWCASGRGFGA